MSRQRKRADSPPAAPLADPVLDELEQAFERGDWGSARAIARGLLASPEAARRTRGREMLDRLAPDRQLLVVYGVCILIFIVVTWSWLSH